VAAEHAAVVIEALQSYRLVERSALRASDESDDGLRDEWDDFVACKGPFGLDESRGVSTPCCPGFERRAYDSRAAPPLAVPRGEIISPEKSPEVSAALSDRANETAA
jgi:hypothetical protein